jgi:hypothetical protein
MKSFSKQRKNAHKRKNVLQVERVREISDFLHATVPLCYCSPYMHRERSPFVHIPV